MTVLTETRERFLRTITAQVSPDRIAEIHFFQPIKQGGAESGVAVVAAYPDVVSPAVEQTVEAPVEELAELAPDVQDEAASTADADVAPAEESAAQPEEEDAVVEAASDASDEASEVVTDAELTPSRDSANSRHTIYTARYRLTLKGPDRGKWEANVVAEADAPLVTVDAVVRGVQRRSGDVDEVTRLDGDEVRTLLAPKQTGTPPTQGAA